MSKFNNLKTLPASGMEYAPVAVAQAAPAGAPVEVEAPAPVPWRENVTLFQKLGLVTLCAYNLSLFANDLSTRFFHQKTYLSLVTELALPVLLLFSGAAFRSLRVRAGKLWLVYFLLLVLDLPFSVWRSGTASLLIDYGVKSWPILFYIASFAVTLRGLRQYMYVQVVASVLLLFSCYAFGQQSSDARLSVEGSLFFNNSNELAMQILFGVAALLFVVLRGSLVQRLLASAAIAMSMIYVLRTASRGALLASIALFVVITMMSRHKVPILGFAALIAMLAGVMVSAPTLNRLKLAFTRSSFYDAKTEDEMSAIASRMQRENLLRRSIWVAITHPLFGVGPGQFPVAESGEAAKKGEWANWLGTHNSYTQVASECGLPAFICYMGVLIWSFRVNYRIFRATRNDDNHRDLYAISFCMLASLVIYAVCTFFDHIAYCGLLAMLGGISISLSFIAARERLFAVAR